MTRSARVERRRGRLLLVATLALLTFFALFAGALPAGAETPGASIEPQPSVTIAPADSGTPAITPAPESSTLPGGANPAVPQPPCPIPPPTPTPEVTPGPTLGPDETPAPPTPAPTPPPHPLCPAEPSGNPGDLLAALFNPIFQTLFLGLAAGYQLFGDIGIAIIVLTLVIKTVLLPLTRAQITSQRRMQMIQPEIKALQTKFKGNRTKVNEETMRLYRERGINPASGCLPAFLQLFLLIPIYSVINTGLGAPDISSALHIPLTGIPVLQGLMCHAPGTLQPCIDPFISWLGLDAHLPQHSFILPVIGFSVSILALMSAFLQLIQTRMSQPKTADPQQASQQRIFLLLPLFSIFYGSFLPAGLFLYWIVFTGYSIIQQYLIAGWGSLFPIFGWTPAFAINHTPRFAPSMPALKPAIASSDSGAGARRTTDQDSRSATDRAAGTIKPARQRGRTSRRGRRR